MLRRWISLFVLLAWLCPAAPAWAGRVFDGNTANYLEAPNIAAYDYASNTGNTNSVGIFVRVKLADTSVNHVILSKTTSHTASGNYWLIWYQASSHTYRFYTGTTYAASITVNDTNWHTFIFTIDQSLSLGSYQLYVDGVDAGSGIGSAVPSTDGQPIDVGGPDLAGITAATATIDFVGVWPTYITSGNAASLETSCTPETVVANALGSWHLYGSDLSDFATGTGRPNNMAVAGGGTVAAGTDALTCGGGSSVRHRRIQ